MSNETGSGHADPGVMSAPRRHLSASERNRLLEGRGSTEPLASLLAAAAGPGTAAETTGLPAATAAFVRGGMQRPAPSGSTGRATLPASTRSAAVKVVIAFGLVGTAGGVAAAAHSGEPSGPARGSNAPQNAPPAGSAASSTPAGAPSPGAAGIVSSAPSPSGGSVLLSPSGPPEGGGGSTLPRPGELPPENEAADTSTQPAPDQADDVRRAGEAGAPAAAAKAGKDPGRNEPKSNPPRTTRPTPAAAKPEKARVPSGPARIRSAVPSATPKARPR